MTHVPEKYIRVYYITIVFSICPLESLLHFIRPWQSRSHLSRFKIRTEEVFKMTQHEPEKYFRISHTDVREMENNYFFAL